MIFDQRPKRIQIVGSSCAGKTTFANELSKRLGIPHIELDALHWEPNWKEADTEVFKERVSSAIKNEEWIVDGQYTGKIGSLVTEKANVIIWLDLHLLAILKRFFIRSLKRTWKREILWDGCQETLRNNIFSKNSLLVWILSTYRARRLKYLSRIANPPKGVSIIRLRNAREVEKFLSSIGKSRPS